MTLSDTSFQTADSLMPHSEYEEEVNEPLHREEVFDFLVRDIQLTHYYTNDSTGSGQCTSSGLCVDDFHVNEYGWYTYQGRVVIATATYRCLRAQTGPCARHNSIPDGFSIYEMHEEITIKANDKLFEAVVLDSCGACMFRINGEPLQRYDIFTVNPNKNPFVKPSRSAQIIQIVPKE